MTERLVSLLSDNGVDIIELGIPFSDPMADGPVIQAASQRALRAGATLGKIFKLVPRLRKKVDLPIAFMTYFNPVFKFGMKRFFASCRKNGVDGVIIPDLPCEEAHDALTLGKRYGVAIIFLVAPTSTKERIKKITGLSKSFVYYVSLTGVTGKRKALPADILSRVRLIKSITDKPVAVGFGVSDPSQARSLARVSDGVIVGSAIVSLVGARRSLPDIAHFVKRMAEAVHDA
jgi:tryptophan synthase alpha chain